MYTFYIYKKKKNNGFNVIITYLLFITFRLKYYIAEARRYIIRIPIIDIIHIYRLKRKPFFFLYFQTVLLIFF